MQSKLDLVSSHHEEINAYTHLIWALIFAAVCGGLVRPSVDRGNFPAVMVLMLYGFTQIGLFVFSYTYHIETDSRLKGFFQKLDHTSIYLKIAGGYTPYIYFVCPPEMKIYMMGYVWALAFLGVAFEIFARLPHRYFSYALYFFLASSVLFMAKPMRSYFSTRDLEIIGAGFISYLIGFGFYLKDEKYPLAHSVWHIFVVLGSLAHAVPVWEYFR